MNCLVFLKPTKKLHSLYYPSENGLLASIHKQIREGGKPDMPRTSSRARPVLPNDSGVLASNEKLINKGDHE